MDNKKLKEIILYLIQNKSNENLKEIIVFLIQNFQIKTNIKLSPSENVLYKDLIEKKLFKLTNPQKLKAKRLLQKIKNKNVLRKAIFYVENLEKRYNRFLELEKKIGNLKKKIEPLNEELKHLKIEQKFQKNTLEEEYKEIKKRQLKTGDPIDSFQAMHLDYIIYKLKEEF